MIVPFKFYCDISIHTHHFSLSPCSVFLLAPHRPPFLPLTDPHPCPSQTPIPAPHRPLSLPLTDPHPCPKYLPFAFISCIYVCCVLLNLDSRYEEDMKSFVFAHTSNFFQQIQTTHNQLLRIQGLTFHNCHPLLLHLSFPGLTPAPSPVNL